MFVYLDESGDLGFDFTKGGTSRFFVATVLVVNDRRDNKCLGKAIERTIKNKILKNKKEKKSVCELKGSKIKLTVKTYFLKQLGGINFHLYSVVLNKARVFDELRANKEKLYNFVARLLIERCPFSQAKEKVILTLDKSKDQKKIKEFNSYLLLQIQKLLPEDVPIEIYHHLSHENKGIQAVDLFSWGIFRKYERKDLDWYKLFQSRIIFESVYLPNKKSL